MGTAEGEGDPAAELLTFVDGALDALWQRRELLIGQGFAAVRRGKTAEVGTDQRLNLLEVERTNEYKIKVAAVAEAVAE